MSVEIKTEKSASPTASFEGSQTFVSERRFQALRRFVRHKLAVVGTIFMIVVPLTSFPLASIATTYHPHRANIQELAQPPSVNHLLGTDMVGRDVWSRLVYGGRVSLSVGLIAVSIYLTIGITLGILAGNFGGRVDSIIMRITDVVMAFPTLIILISIVAIIGPGLFNSMIAIGLLGWAGVARLVRGQSLSIREMDFIMAARATGVPERRVILRHIFPNLVAPLTVAASFGVAGTILTEAGLSFLGLGVKIPVPSWGNMLNEAQSITIIEKMPWLWVPPGLMISLCVLSINFIGDALRDALDPRMLLD